MAEIYSIMVGMALIAAGAFDESTNPSDGRVSEKKAIAALEKLGAKVYFRSPAANRDGEDREAEQKLRQIVIDGKWTDGDEGVDQIEQLPKLPRLLIAGPPKISEERLAKLKKTMPGLAIERRPAVYLGVSLSTTPEGFRIADVSPESPAGDAGLAVGDRIKQFDGSAVEDFDDLLKLLCLKNPGDEVDVTVLRKGMSVNVKVKLRKWQ